MPRSRTGNLARQSYGRRVSTPLYGARIDELYPRAAVFCLTPMAADPSDEEDLAMPDIGLQLILEGLRNGHFPASGPGAAELAEIERLKYDFDNKARHKAFYAVARYLIYDVESVVETGVYPPRDDVDGGAWGSQATVTVIGRFPWLFSSLRKNSIWESYIYSYSELAWT